VRSTTAGGATWRRCSASGRSAVSVKAPLLSLRTLHAVLSSEALDRVIRSLSGSVAVSAYELEAVPLPAAEVLPKWDSLEGDELSAAVDAAYQVMP